jgi:hypothetical protein
MWAGLCVFTGCRFRATYKSTGSNLLWFPSLSQSCVLLQLNYSIDYLEWLCPGNTDHRSFQHKRLANLLIILVNAFLCLPRKGRHRYQYCNVSEKMDRVSTLSQRKSITTERVPLSYFLTSLGDRSMIELIPSSYFLLARRSIAELSLPTVLRLSTERNSSIICLA